MKAEIKEYDLGDGLSPIWAVIYDGYIYPFTHKHMVESLAERLEINPNAARGYSGWQVGFEPKIIREKNESAKAAQA